jgi:hypothetical protein
MKHLLVFIHRFAALRHPTVRPGEQLRPKTGIDILSLMLVGTICCVCLMVSVFAATSGFDPSRSLP